MDEKTGKQKEMLLTQPNDTKILLVEDSPTQAEKLKHLLEDEGFSVDLVYNSQDALEYLNTHTPTIIISDVLMEGIDGFDLCARLKQNKTTSHIPVMLLTSLAEPQDIIRGLESGADNFVTKPYDREHLTSQINYMLANAQLRKLSKIQNKELPHMGIEIFFAGKKQYIKSTQLQILDLLFSSFEVYIRKNRQLEEMNRRLTEKNERIKALHGLVPICAKCKKIRDDHGYWQQVEFYLEEHSEAGFNQSICPQCSQIERNR